MKFFFPGTLDQVDPGYDFENERHTPGLPLRDYWYPHQALHRAPYDGILISRAQVDPSMSSSRSIFRRWRRLTWGGGARKFLHLNGSDSDGLLLMGDCGAYSYVNQEAPPITTAEAIDFYSVCGVDYGLSVDHIIPGFIPPHSKRGPRSTWRERYHLTLQYAREFWNRTNSVRSLFHPVGVAQGWSAPSYATAVNALQRIGYSYIALGGLSRLGLTDLATCLEAIQVVRRPSTRIHLLGITPLFERKLARRWGISSFDCTTPFRQAFLNERNNYHTSRRTYLAIRVPRVDQNRTMRRRIDDEDVSFSEARSMERECLRLLRDYDRDRAPLDNVLNAIRAYEMFFNARDHSKQYRRLLSDRPWKQCPCQLCRALGIEIVLLRDKQRNNRRGFHNLYVFYQKLQSRTHNAH